MNSLLWQRLLVVLCFTVLLAPVARGQTLQKYVVGSGAAGPAAANGITMVGTVGQTIIGHVSSSSSVGDLGFWYTLVSTTSDVREEHGAQTGAEIASLQVFPNPVSDQAQIRVMLPTGGPITLKLYDAVGREQRTLIEGDREAGVITVQFGAADLASGNYTLVLSAGGIHRTTTMRVIK